MTTADYPRFSDVEMARRHAAVAEAMAARDVDHLLVYGANRSGLAVGWLTRWPVTREAFVLVTPGEPDTLFVDFFNHVPNARRIATEADVRACEGRGIEPALAELRRRSAAGRRIGVIGPLPWRQAAALAEVAGDVVGLDADFTRLRLVKSAEEIDWLRIGCELTDRGVEALRAGARPGVDERELGALVESAYLGRGGTTHIHYFATTPMDRPGLTVPAQWPSSRTLAAGDALVCEISASWWDHPGQVLRTFVVDAEPTPLYRELHDVAEAAFDAVAGRLRAGATAAELVDASGVIEDAGFTIRDDLVHGFVGGYLPPVLGSRSRMLGEVPDFTFAAGMTVVVQPNVITPDERAGVQTGELLLVTEDGTERLHDLPRGVWRLGSGGRRRGKESGHEAKQPSGAPRHVGGHRRAAA
jgi:Xaa-Pro aminopeptidase